MGLAMSLLVVVSAVVVADMEESIDAIKRALKIKDDND